MACVRPCTADGLKVLRSLRLDCARFAACPLVPRFGRDTRIHPHHGDAVYDGTNERAEIAANTFRFVHARNARKRRGIRALRARSLHALLTRDWRDSNRRAAARFIFRWSRMQLHRSVNGTRDTIEMDTLMRAIPAGDVAEIAA